MSPDHPRKDVCEATPLAPSLAFIVTLYLVISYNFIITLYLVMHLHFNMMYGDVNIAHACVSSLWLLGPSRILVKVIYLIVLYFLVVIYMRLYIL